jgi:hypothetical protein
MSAARGHVVTVADLGQDAAVPLVSYGEYLFDNVVLAAPCASQWRGLSAQSLFSFVENGGNVVAASAAPGACASGDGVPSVVVA